MGNNNNSTIQTELKQWVKDMKEQMKRKQETIEMDAWDLGWTDGVIATLDAIDKGFL